MTNSIKYTVKVIEGDEEGTMTITIALPKTTLNDALAALKPGQGFSA